jgi:hypothetical protein
LDFTKEDFELWWNSEITTKIRERFQREQETITELVMSSGTLADTPGLTAQLTARAVGEAAGLNYFLKKEFLEDD